MQFTIVITKQAGEPWRASIPILPGCEVEGVTREEALAGIKERLSTITRHIEFVQIEAPQGILLNGEEKAFAETWPGFGAHPGDPNWGKFFEELDQQRQ